MISVTRWGSGGSSALLARLQRVITDTDADRAGVAAQVGQLADEVEAHLDSEEKTLLVLETLTPAEPDHVRCGRVTVWRR